MHGVHKISEASFVVLTKIQSNDPAGYQLERLDGCI